MQNTSQLNNVADTTSYSTTCTPGSLNESEHFPHVDLVCVKWRGCYGVKLIYSPTSTPVTEIFYTRNTKEQDTLTTWMPTTSQGAAQDLYRMDSLRVYVCEQVMGENGIGWKACLFI